MFHNLNINEYKGIYLLLFQCLIFFIALLGAGPLTISRNLFYLLAVMFLSLFAGGIYFSYREKNWILLFLHLLVFLVPIVLAII